MLDGMSDQTVSCWQCGAIVADCDGPVHSYVPSAPGCWKVFGEVQADAALRFGYSLAQGVVVDAYMAQHPGDGCDRRDRQSVFVHLAGLHAALELGLPPTQAINVLRLVQRGHDDFPVLNRDHGPGELTIVSLVGAGDAAEYERRARAWGSAVWTSWSQHHKLIRDAVSGARGSS
jgi:hypothetical protein